MDAAPSGCDVVGCEAPATGTNLHAGDARLVEVGICSDHYGRLQAAEQPVVAHRCDRAALDGGSTLLLELPVREDRDRS